VGVDVTQGLFADVPNLQDQNRIWSTHEAPLRGDHIIEALQTHHSVLCVCNQVDRAQSVYEQVQHLGLPDDTDCLLLHSRFYKEHRSQKEEWAREWLGKREYETENGTEERYGPHDGRRKVIIATQVVEVGLDITADVLLTECAPAASLIQRAGRCARGGGTGYVRVHLPPADEHGQTDFAPYTEDGLRDVCRLTWESLNTQAFGSGQGMTLHYHDEQRLINAAHSQHDQDTILDGLGQKLDARLDQMLASMRENNPGYARSLIRENNSVRLFIMGDLQNAKLTQRPLQLEGFSVSQGRIAREFEAMAAAAPDAPFLVASGQDVSDQTDSDDLQTDVRYKWHPLREGNDAYGQWLFVAHPFAVAYDENFGLRWRNDGQAAPESPEAERRRYQSSGIDPDTYTQHIGGLMAAYTRPDSNRGYRALRRDYQHALIQTAKQLDTNLDWSKLDRYLRLTLALHDVGKLNQPWQTWAITRHRLFVERFPDEPHIVPADGTPLAHTVKGKRKFPTEDDEKAFEEAFWTACRVKRGNHAVESAEAAREIILQAVKKDWRWYGIISAAICHHHTPSADKINAPFNLSDGGQQAVTEGLIACGFDTEESSVMAAVLQSTFNRASRGLTYAIEATLPQRSDYQTALMYYLFVRLLRLADQRSSDYVHS